MKAKHDFSYRAAICALIFAFALGGVSLANAKGYAPAVAKNSTGFDIKFASNGTPLANMSNTATGVAVGATAALPLSSSVIIQAAASGAVTGAAAGGAWGAAAGALGGLALLAIPVIVDWMQSAGVGVRPDGTYTGTDTSVCTVAPCLEYYFPYRAHLRASTAYGAASMVAADVGGSVVSCGDRQCEFLNSSGSPFSLGFEVASVAPSPTPPATSIASQEAVSRMSAPSPTAAQVQALIDLNFPPVVTLPNVTGSPRAYLGNTVQMFSPDEKKIVDSWANLDYSQPGKVGVQIETKTTIEKAASTSTVTTVNADGTTSTSAVLTPAKSVTTTTLNNGSTQTTTVTSPDGSTTTTSSPTPDSEKPEDPCIKNPNRIGCLDVDTPDLEVPKSSRTISYQAENPFGDGSCPANVSMQFGTLQQSYTVWDWSKTCAMALPLRALVLALASFAAFLILMPGKVET